MSVENLLSRLQKVKPSGKHRWLCACPAHQDKSPSMHILLADDGKILINCKAGCDTYSILQSVGLDWVDVMPEKATHHRQNPKKQILYATEALELLQYEARIILACAIAMKNNALKQQDLDRAMVSMQTINKITLQAGL
jgi:hypothetical protein